MANETVIDRLITSEAITNLEKADAALQSLKSTYIEVGKQLASSLNIKVDNLPDLAKQTENYQKLMDKLTQTIDHFNSLTEKYQSSIDQIVAIQKKATDIQKQYNQSTQQSTQATQQNEEIKKKSIVSEKEVNRLISITLGTRMQNALALAREQTIIKSLLVERNRLDKLEKSHAITIDDATKTRMRLILSEKEHRQASLELQQILNNEQKIINSTVGSMEQESLILERMRMTWRKLTEEQKGSLAGQTLNKNIQDLDTKLKKLDANIGNHQRNVGNYKSHWDGLGNSINQITREMPAFVVSLNTGILALSNNIPILADEINRLKKSNEGLRAEGKPTVSVFRQISKSFLSWQTLLSIGVTLLTIYGEDIFNWAKGLLMGGEAAVKAADAQKTLNNLQKEGSLAAAEEMAKLELLYMVTQNVTVSMQERIKAAEQLQQQYPEYLGNFSKEAIIAGEASLAYQNMAANIINVAKARILEEKYAGSIKDISKELAKQHEIEQKISSLRKEMPEAFTDEYREFAKNNESKVRELGVLNFKLETSKRKVRQLQETYKDFSSEYAKSLSNRNPADLTLNNSKALTDYLNKQNELNESIKLGEINQEEYDRALNQALGTMLKTVKQQGIMGADIDYYTEKYKKQNKALADNKDAEKGAKDRVNIIRENEDIILNLTMSGRRKERQILINEYDRRIEDTKQYGSLGIQLIESLQRQREKALTEFDEETMREAAKKEVNLRLESVRKGSEEEHVLRLELLEMRKREELKGIEENGRTAEENNSLILALEQKYNKLREDENIRYSQATLETNKRAYDQRLLDTGLAMKDELAKASEEYAKGILTKEQYEKKKLEIQREYSRKTLELTIKSAEDAVKILPEGSKERIKAEEELVKARIALSNMEKDIIIKNNENIQSSFQKWMEEHQRQINNAFETANALGNLFSSIGDMYDGRIQKIEDEQDANEAATEEEIANIEHLEDVGVYTTEEAEAKKRAAEEKTAQRNKELDKQRAELQTRQAKFQKAASITQTIINTAEAFMKAMTAGPIIGPILASIVAETGAIRLSTIIAQPIPKYAKGTDDHPGGLAIVGDGGKAEGIIINGKLYKSPAVPTVIDLPEHAQVLPDLHAIDSPEFIDRCINSAFWLTHNMAGEPVQIINNFDTTPLLEEASATRKEIRNLTKMVSKNFRNSDYNRYKYYRM